MTINILYLTFDLCDAATWRRVDMLKLGGARVTLAGFHRDLPPEGDDETCVIPLGKTANGRFVQRILSVVRARFCLSRALKGINPPDIVLARNLETLALAPQIRRAFPSVRGIVYECLDIHRLQLGHSIPSRAIRFLERRLLAQTDLILTSSPAFVRNYFAPVLKTNVPVKIVENKCLPGHVQVALPPNRGPVVIGWFGKLRCQASLSCLDQFTRRHPGAFHLVLRGRPALDAIPDFHATVSANPDLSYLGPYEPEELPSLYGQVHLSWGIDRYEAGANSEWLLPNRLYEGSCFGAVPIVLKGTETARFLTAKGLGITISDVTPKALARIANLTIEDVVEHRALMMAAPASLWSFTDKDCGDLVKTLMRVGRTQINLTASLQSEAIS